MFTLNHQNLNFVDISKVNAPYDESILGTIDFAR